MNVCYFFVEDKIDNGEVYVEHCPTEQMCDYLLIKHQQGMEFCVMRSHSMNVYVNYR